MDRNKQLCAAFDELTVCEDEPSHYEYWRDNVNADKDDCCNLRKGSA